MQSKQSNEKDKRILIIPAAGRSSRFPDVKPKWLLTHPKGKLMIQEVVSGINLEDYDECHIVVLKEHCEKHDADYIIKQVFGDLFKITILDRPTKCSPETVVECIKKNNIVGNIVVKDCDCFVEFNIPDASNFVVGIDANESDMSNLSSKSFIKADLNGIINEIIEKQIVSNIVCLGVYGINSDLLLNCYDRFFI